MQFEEASRNQILLRMALVGPPGSGKSLGALTVARGVVDPGARIVGVDTEKGRLKLYADRFAFLHGDLRDHSPEGYRDAVRDAALVAGTGGVVVLDSFSHEWMEVLTEADKFGDWKTLSPRHKDAVQAILDIECHLIVTMRAKVKYDVSEEDVPGRTKPRQVITRLGIGPVQREGVEYEFDIIGHLDSEHVGHWTNRCEALVGKTMPIDDEFVKIVVTWLDEGDPPPPPPPFDPAVDLLPHAIRGNNAAHEILAALESRAPHIDWRETLPALGVAAFGKPSRELKGERYIEWYRRLSNSVAKLDEFAPNDLPLPTDAQIVEAFAFGFPGVTFEITLASEKDDTPAEAPATDEAVVIDEADEAAAAEAFAAENPEGEEDESTRGFES